MKTYEIPGADGSTITVQLDDDEAERRGLKQAAPKNKQATPKNKQAAPREK